MAEFWGLDADTWGNVIAAATGFVAVGGGIVTVFLTAKQNRDAARKAREADREAELRAQSREALARVVGATSRYADTVRAYQQAPLEDRENRERRDGDAARFVQQVTEAAGLIAETRVRSALLLAVRGHNLASFAFRSTSGPNLGHRFAFRDHLMQSAGALAAASLREDSVELAKSEAEIVTQHDVVAKKLLRDNRGSED